jgi:hypothetical protein
MRNALVENYLSKEFVRLISRDPTATAWRENPVKKVAKEQKKPPKRGRPVKGYKMSRGTKCHGQRTQPGNSTLDDW